MKLYDIIIIGGGIAGIYTMYNLVKKYPKLNVLLLEKNNRFGGRIYTYCETVDNVNYCMDFGAGRLGFHHKNILNLLKKLNLNKNIIPIPNDKTYIEIKKNKGIDKTNYKDDIMNELFNFINSSKIKNLSKKKLQRYTLNELIEKYHSKDFLKNIENVFEYYQDLYLYNAYDAINYFKEDYNLKSKFFTIKGGLYTIIDNMIKFIKNINKNTYKLKLNCDVTNISKTNDNKFFNIQYNNGSKSINILSKFLICALPRKNLINFNFLNNFKYELNSIKDIDLLRIFEIYDKNKSNDIWFKNIKKTIVNNELQFVIPINKDNGLIMSSYTELHNSKYWMKHYNNDKTKNKTNFKNLLNSKLSNTFDINVPHCKWLKLFYWDMGVGSWKKNYDSDLISNKMLNLLDNFYICGENYSKLQAWCEGALDTSNKVLKLLKNKLKNIKTKKNRKSKIKKTKTKKTKIKSNFITLQNKINKIQKSKINKTLKLLNKWSKN